MKDTVTQYLDKAKSRLSKRKKAVAVLLTLSLVVATGTTWSLHQTGESLTKEAYCGITEHTHTDACKEKVLICGQEESEGHVHTDACYEEQKVLTCGLEESAGHTHTEACYDEEGNLICGQEESEGHTHTDACYTTEKVLICGQEESEGHTHTDECYEEQYICGFDQEHTHTLACYSNPNADVESASVWEQTFAGVTLTGDAGKDVVAIAKTQLGYTESANNYQVVTADDGTEKAKGYTRYGAWYGSPYEDWCAMFASFCISYAHVDYPLEASCPNWISNLSATGRYVTRDAWTPAIGDLVFFDQNGDGTSDHVGIVSALTAGGSELAEDADVTTADGIKTIEGNSSDQVKENSYTLNNSAIVGYGVLPVKEAETVALSATTDDGSITVTATASADSLPDGATLTARILDGEQERSDVADELDKNNVSYDGFVAVDVAFLDANGNEVEPTGPVSVNMELTQAALPEGTSVSSITIQHLEENDAGEVTEVKAMTEAPVETGAANTVAEFTVDSFSTFAITYDETAANDGIMTLSLADGTDLNTAQTVTINFYAFVNGQRVLVKTQSVQSYYYNYGNTTNDTTHRCISAEVLEEVYGDYGFTASSLSAGDYKFAHTGTGGSTFWHDRPAIADGNGNVFAPILNAGSNSCDIYYLPNSTSAASNVSWNNSTYMTSQSVPNTYTITVTDPNHLVYASDSDIPAATTANRAASATVTVNKADGVTWYCVGSNGNTVTGTENSNGTVSFTISKVTDNYTVYPMKDGQVGVTYVLNTPKTPYDTEYDTPKIGGSSTNYTDYADKDSGYTLLSPSITSYVYVESGKYKGTAKFLGWSTNKNATTPDEGYEAGKEINVSDNITLYGVWSTGGASTSSITGPYVNFFVALTAVPEGTTNWTGSTNTSFFTQSVYATNCGVNGSDVRDYGGNYTTIINAGSATQYIVKGGTSGDLESLHEDVVNNLTAGFTETGTDNNTYSFKCTIPTDEEVLRNVRTMVENGSQITINGHTLTADELTAENFTVKWNVFKWDNTDGWHVDGLLIAKTGKMKVTKTFAGDESTVADIKKSYGINVAGESGVVHTSSASLNLNEKSTSNTSGYDSYDESSNTYTWYVDVDQFYDYTVSENNYQSTNTEVTTNAGYNVSNAKTTSQNTTGWQTYSKGVTVTGQTYDESTGSGLLTVSYLNTYVKAGTLIVQKNDSTTGNLMKNIKFAVAKSGDTDFQLYQQLNNGTAYVGHYTDQSTADDGTVLTAVTDNIIQTDANGQAYLAVSDGTYTLTEQVVGYKDPGVITVSLTNGTNGSTKIVMINSASSENKDDNNKDYATFAEGTLTLNVANTSPTTSVTMVKDWGDEEKKQVTLQLYRNGESMGSDYLVTLDGTTDSKETTAWQVTFNDLPLYVDGEQAKYSIRETNIGGSKGFNYSSEYDDGYKYYDVTVSNMVYKDADGNVVTDPTQAANGGSCTITCSNRLTTAEVYFTKVSSAGGTVSGAEFYLYKLNDATKPTDGSVVGVNLDNDNNTQTLDTEDTDAASTYTYQSSATSDSSGKVSFGSKLADGYYYLIEHKAPRGYELNQTLYLIHKDGGDVTIEYWNEVYDENGDYVSSGWVGISNKQISNEAKTMTANLTITKKAAGNNGAVLPGAEFTLTNKSGQYYSGSGFTSTETKLTSDADGLISIEGLPAGSYTLTETKAPDGYNKLSSTITFTVTNDGQVTNLMMGTTSNTTLETKQTSDGYDCSFTVDNSTGAELPETGGAGTTLFTLSGLGLMALALVYGCGLRRRRERRAR